MFTVIKATMNEPEQIVSGLHEPLISNEIFNNVQRVLKGRRPISNYMAFTIFHQTQIVDNEILPD